ncbi:amino acid ABC transporter membrane protein (PAAT family) [Arthrobacter sp. AG258]|uniref:amino acid ABC transporter permease n=1 Tax=Arthrobacter sp. AG258 TaxID=2183899 RepID=UPI00105B2421|nr:amino acid ABC transporter permease [Arthrobacter sp. AG258]TDT78641.1 amino acid ABC transporter membrane protein (PAAT family) [Arthrobacter sp. AG258]
MKTQPAPSITGTAAADLKIVPRRHIGRWIGAAAVVLLLVWLAVSFSRAKINWPTVQEYLAVPVLIQGIGVALILTAVAMAIGLVLGVVTAVMRLSKNPVVSGVAWLYIWVFRGTPVYLQLLMWFNLALIFPVIGIPGLYSGRMIDILTPFVAASIGLGLNQGAYTSEVVRGGILSVDEGQLEAAQAVGMTRLQAMRRIVLPQAMRVIIPPVGNEVIGMLKTTSLASAIGVSEILSEAQHIYYVNNRIMELLIVCAVWYLGAVSILSIGQFYLERFFAKGSSSRQLPMTPLQRLSSIFGTKRKAQS